MFNRLSKEKELAILLADNGVFTATKKYLEPLILAALLRIPDEDTRNKTYRNLIQIVPVAAKRYLDGKEKNSKIYFSVYFTWYISEEFKKLTTR